MTTIDHSPINYFPIAVQIDVIPPSKDASSCELIEKSARFGIELNYTVNTDSLVQTFNLIRQNFGRSNHNRRYSFRMTINLPTVRKATGIFVRTIFFDSKAAESSVFSSSANTTLPISSKLTLVERESFDCCVSAIDTKQIKYLIDFTSNDEVGFAPQLEEYL